MKYRVMPCSGDKISALGFGCMRFPTIDGKIDYSKAEKLIEKAYEGGVNYYDGAYPYHGGQAETFMGDVLSGIRDKIFMATKLPPQQIEKPEDMYRIFDEQLKKLKTDHVDYYLLHGISDMRVYNKVVDLGLLKFFDEIKKDGRAKHVGFSSHANESDFKKIANSYDYEFVQIQFNYYDVLRQMGIPALRFAAEKNLGVIVMEPQRGGLLSNIEDEAKLAHIKGMGTPAEMAFRFVIDRPEVTCVLSGMSTMQQVEENLATFDKFEAGNMSEAELQALTKIRESFESQIQVECTACGYCMPCPFGVDIPISFRCLNDAHMVNMESGKRTYNIMTQRAGYPDSGAGQCQKCGLCETKCPQHISIREKLEQVRNEFGR
ncbi:MAG: aldo/keto reductase [Christensenellaceae bacterium]|nr:aldo/keto reductase [Christensenellaceae bacterium]